MADLFGFSAETVARIWRAMLYVERNLYPRQLTGNDRHRPLPRTYRRFTLTAELAGGAVSGAAVTWDDGTTGTVYDPDKCAHGLEGESGEAAAYLDAGGGIQWRVTKNPGQPVYEGTAAGDISATATTATVNVTIEGATRSVTAAVPSGAISTGKKYASGGRLFISHQRGTWKIISFVGCEATA